MYSLGLCCKRGVTPWIQTGKQCFRVNSPVIMTVAAANDSSSNVSNGRRDIQVRLMSSAPKSPSQAAQAMENFQSKDHEFSAYRHRDTVDRAAEYGFNMEANLGCLAKGDDNRHDAPEYEVPDTYGMESVAQEEVDRVEMFSNRGEVSLDSVMQSNVPEPFQPQGRNPSHMNMPGGGKGRTNRYLYSNVHGTHPNKQYSTLARHSADTDILVCRAHGMPADAHALFRHNYSTESRPSGGTSSDEVSGTGGVSPDGQLTQRQKLQRAVKEYGSTVIVFHVAISLASLGGFYLAVSSGLDVVGLLGKIGVGESILQSKLATGASTFVVAYAVHKVFAPVRIAITLTSTPFIVRYLRGVGFLKPPTPKSS